MGGAFSTNERTEAEPANASGPPWIERITLTDFRNHAALTLAVDRGPVVLVGPNGAGKTNILEAVSLLAPGQGLRRAPYAEIARKGASGWAVAARLNTAAGAVDIGTGLLDTRSAAARSGRLVRVNGEAQSGSGVLADLVEMVWLTPSHDGLFTGSGGDRRRFLDRMVLCLDPGYRTRVAHFERAMAQRNRLLEEGVSDDSRLGGLETVMAETGVAVAAARSHLVTALQGRISARHEREPDSPFPWARLTLEGTLERELVRRPAIEVEDQYARSLARGRERDRAAGRALLGPHRSDLATEHGPKGQAAALCSTGEQKALLVGLVLAHAELIAGRRGGAAPILLLDEIAAHLDAARREALFSEIVRLGAQAWLTGTDSTQFDALAGRATRITIDAEGRPAGDRQGSSNKLIRL